MLVRLCFVFTLLFSYACNEKVSSDVSQRRLDFIEENDTRPAFPDYLLDTSLLKGAESITQEQFLDLASQYPSTPLQKGELFTTITETRLSNGCYVDRVRRVFVLDVTAEELEFYWEFDIETYGQHCPDEYNEEPFICRFPRESLARDSVFEQFDEGSLSFFKRLTDESLLTRYDQDDFSSISLLDLAMPGPFSARYVDEAGLCFDDVFYQSRSITSREFQSIDLENRQDITFISTNSYFECCP